MTGPYPIPLSPEQEGLLNQYAELLLSVNKQFNLISRSDITLVKQHHISHCLSYAGRSFKAGSTIVDWGSGGGLPAIPIAILSPDSHVIAVDSNGNKTRSIDLFCRKLGIANCEAWHGRAESFNGRADYSVSRATASLSLLWHWHARIANAPQRTDTGQTDTGQWPMGLICLKGGDLREEMADLQSRVPTCRIETQRLTLLAGDPYFDTKVLIHVSESND